MGKKDKKGVTFSVRRAPAHFLKDSCSKISKLSKRQLMASPIWVKFDGEDAVDEGGVNNPVNILPVCVCVCVCVCERTRACVCWVFACLCLP